MKGGDEGIKGFLLAAAGCQLVPAPCVWSNVCGR